MDRIIEMDDFEKTEPRMQLYCGDCKTVLTKITQRHPWRNIFFCSDLPYNIKFKHYDNYSDDLALEQYIDLLKVFRGYRAAFMHFPEGISHAAVPALGPFERSVMWCYRGTCNRSLRQIAYWNDKPDFKQVRRPYKCEPVIKGGRQNKQTAASYDWWDDIAPLKGKSLERRGHSHPCTVPIELMGRILTLCAKQGDIVIDPFSGVQTTGIAAYNLGLDYIGIDISPTYVMEGAERIRRVLGVEPEVYEIQEKLRMAS